MVSRQTRFCPGGPTLSESHGSWAVFMFAFCSCNSTEFKRYTWPYRLASYRFVCISLYIEAVYLGKNWRRKLLNFPRLQTVAGFLLVCGPWGRHQESYLPVPWLCKERGQELEYDCRIIHVNFDHACAEHYPVTLERPHTKSQIAICTIFDKESSR